MEPGEARTVCILRRMKRKQLSLFTFRPYDPTKATSDELKFDVLDDRERTTGQLAYEKLGIKFMKIEDTNLSTPWGQGTIRSSKEGVRILLNGRELFLMGGSILKRGFELTSPAGVKLVFHPVKGKRNDIEYSDDNGYIAVVEEKGKFSAPPQGHSLQPTKEEINAMPKENRPRSVESLEYLQYRIKMAGSFLVSQDDLVAALTIFASYGCLITEIPT